MNYCEKIKSLIRITIDLAKPLIRIRFKSIWIRNSAYKSNKTLHAFQDKNYLVTRDWFFERGVWEKTSGLELGSRTLLAGAYSLTNGEL